MGCRPPQRSCEWMNRLGKAAIVFSLPEVTLNHWDKTILRSVRQSDRTKRGGRDVTVVTLEQDALDGGRVNTCE